MHVKHAAGNPKIFPVDRKIREELNPGGEEPESGGEKPGAWRRRAGNRNRNLKNGK